MSTIQTDFITRFHYLIIRLATKILPESQFIYSLCRLYIDRINGDNNFNIKTNGEQYLLEKYLPESTVVFDVGANVGDWASQALAIKPGIRLHCFEPSKWTYEHLIGNNFPPNVICNNVGCGETTSELTLYSIGNEKVSTLKSLFKRNNLGHLGLSAEYSMEKVAIISLDEYCELHKIERIDIVKIDVEGFELQVIKGMKKILAEERVRIVQFEYGGTYIDSRTFLADIWETVLTINPNYLFYKLHRKGLKHVAEYSPLLENFQLQNWAIIKKT